MRALIPVLFLGASCGLFAAPEHGHDHGHEHAEVGGHAPHGDSADHADESVSVAITRWTDTHELFVELDAPVAGHHFGYHAHVTRLADNHAATSGALTFRFEADGAEAASHTDSAVARPGIFASDAAAPGKAGRYRLMLTYTDGDERASWDAGTVEIGASEPVPHAGEDEGEITLLKEAQWQIPFEVRPAGAVPLAPVVKASAVVVAAPDQARLVAAPTDGLFVWSGGLPVVGRRVTRGEQLAALVPAGAAESWSRLQADLAKARVDLDAAQKELARVETLRTRDLLSERRLQEAQAGVGRATAEVSATGRRVSALTSERSGAMPIRAPADGIIVAVGGGHGTKVQAGAPLVTVSSGDSVMLDGHVHERRSARLDEVRSVAVHRGDWAEPRELPGARVLTERLVFDAHTLSAPLTVIADDPAGLVLGDLVELQVGVGKPTPRLALPRGAVVEINGQDIVFVQKTGESFTRRRVTLGAADPAHVEILSGIEAGEQVVVEGGFDVHVASLSGALESHKH